MSNTKKIKVKKKKEKEEVDSFTLMVRESLGSVGRSVNPYQEKLLVQLMKSFLVGGIATIADLILYFILYHFIHINPMIANLITFVITIVFSFFMSKKYVFDKNSKKQVKEFCILAIVNLLITELLLFGLVYKIKWNAMLIKILAVLIVIIAKILIKRFIFNRKKHH